ncbi:MAG: hypothetical protein EXS37_16490 [Opitutus sp.]|nr:hypothetical protein [Opitutus sp.]
MSKKSSPHPPKNPMITHTVIHPDAAGIDLASEVHYVAVPADRVPQALDQMNVLLHRAVTDITGTTGLAILDAIVAGERDPRKIAAHRDHRCKKSEAGLQPAGDGVAHGGPIVEPRRVTAG